MSILPVIAAAAAGERASIMDIHPGLTFWTIVTFVVVAFVLKKAAWKPILGMLDERERTIRDTIESARRERAEAERLLAEQKESIAEARREAADLVRKNQAEVEAAKQAGMTQAKKDAEEYLAAARKAIQEERVKAVAEVRAVAVDLALATAGKLLEVNLDDAKQRQLAEDFLKKMPVQPKA
jgi:F-type H+-transporting ATPase subunit b